jgi:uncharacterized protein YbaR (Trm112 family)
MDGTEQIGKVLQLIVCPACREKLFLGGQRVQCTACRRSYPIEDGIPVLLVERAAIQS